MRFLVRNHKPNLIPIHRGFEGEVVDMHYRKGNKTKHIRQRDTKIRRKKNTHTQGTAPLHNKSNYLGNIKDQTTKPKQS